MKHLTDDDLFCLAELTEEMKPYSKHETEQMEHIKICEECYEKFCSALALASITSESGYMVLSDIYNISKNTSEVSLSKKALAVLRVIRKNIETSVSAVIEQIEQTKAAFIMEPPMAAAVRGTETVKSSIFKVEDIEDEKTFVLFDQEKNKLMIQINTKNITEKDIIAYIVFEKNKKIEVPLIKEKNIAKGIIDDIPQMDFDIYIEEK